MTETTNPAPAHPTWEGKTEAWKFAPDAYLKQVLQDFATEKGITDLGTLLLLSDFATVLRDSLEAGIKSLMSPISGLNLDRPDIAAISEGDALHMLLDDIRSLWNEVGAPGTFVGTTTPMTDQEHKDLHAKMIDNTRNGHDVDLATATPMHGVYIQGTSSAICITGNTPLAHRRATLISMLLSAIPGIFVIIKMAEANLKAPALDPEAVALLVSDIPATVAPSNDK